MSERCMTCRALSVLEEVARHMKGINIDGHTRVDGDDIACARNWEKLRVMVNDVTDSPVIRRAHMEQFPRQTRIVTETTTIRIHRGRR